ncbi:MAG: hypothetical protein ACOX22_08635 [Caldicoprobacterales bacterium]|jgi:hypothetical protein|nr:hypothetical protein [Clostridiales bacterium]
MFIAILNIITTASLLIGMIICFYGSKSKKLLYKGGFFFFLFSFLSKLYSLILRYYIESLARHLTEKSSRSIGFWLAYLPVPGDLLALTGIIIFIVYLSKGLSYAEHETI